MTESGSPLPFERQERYQARRVRDRLDRALLIDYLQALGVDADDDTFYREVIAVDHPVYGVTRTRAEALAWLEVTLA